MGPTAARVPWIVPGRKQAGSQAEGRGCYQLATDETPWAPQRRTGGVLGALHLIGGGQSRVFVLHQAWPQSRAPQADQGKVDYLLGAEGPWSMAEGAISRPKRSPMAICTGTRVVCESLSIYGRLGLGILIITQIRRFNPLPRDGTRLRAWLVLETHRAKRSFLTLPPCLGTDTGSYGVLTRQDPSDTQGKDSISSTAKET